MRTAKNYFYLVFFFLVFSACGEGDQANLKLSVNSSSPNSSLQVSGHLVTFDAASGINSQPVENNPLALTVTGVAVAQPFPLGPPNSNPYFSLSTPTAAFYPHVSSLDFDLGLTYLGSPYSSLFCQARFPVINPPTAFISNADGVDAQGVAFIRFGIFNNTLLSTLKTRRVEVDTAGSASVSFSIDITCLFLKPLPNSPLVTTVMPTIGSFQDTVTVNGFNFLGPSTATTTVTISGVMATIQLITNNQIVISVPAGSQTGALIVKKSPSTFRQIDKVGTFRVDAILEETFTDAGVGPTSGMLVTALYPVGSIDLLTGCPTQPDLYRLFTFNFDISSGSALHESPRVPPGTYDTLAWIDPTVSGATKPLAGNRMVANLSNTVQIVAQQRTQVSHIFAGTYSANCP